MKQDTRADVRGNSPTVTSSFLARAWRVAVVGENSKSDQNNNELRGRGSESGWSAHGPIRRCRVEQRHHVDTTAVIRLITLAADVCGQIVDISLGGCCIRTEQRFPLGIFRRVEVEFHLEGLPFRLAGVTQAIYDPFKVGIRFLDLSDRKRNQLLQLIDEIRKADQDDPDAKA